MASEASKDIDPGGPLGAPSRAEGNYEFKGNGVCQTNVRNFNEGLAYLDEHCIPILDIDGTILSLDKTLRLGFKSIRNSVERILHFPPTPIDTIDLETHFIEIKEAVYNKTGMEPIIVSNRIYNKGGKSFYYKFLDRMLGTTYLVEALNKAGFKYRHMGMDRQTGGLIAIKGSWEIFIQDIKRIQENSQRTKLIIIADQLNIIGAIANERKFLEKTMVILSKHSNSDKFEGLSVNIIFNKEKILKALHRMYLSAFVQSEH